MLKLLLLCYFLPLIGYFSLYQYYLFFPSLANFGLLARPIKKNNQTRTVAVRLTQSTIIGLYKHRLSTKTNNSKVQGQVIPWLAQAINIYQVRSSQSQTQPGIVVPSIIRPNPSFVSDTLQDLRTDYGSEASHVHSFSLWFIK